MGIYGTLEQKQRHLPAIAAGREKWAIGFTEPGGGTDVLGAMRLAATRADGGWIINGQKTWSSMAHLADYILLLVRTTRDVARQYQGVSLFILPTASDGVTIREIPKLGMRALGSCDVFLDDVFVADENLLGQPDQAWKMLLPTLNNERIMLSAFCVGILLMSLAGHQLPSGSARPEPYQNWLLHEAFYSPPEPHPVAAFVLANRGIGISLADLFRLFGSDIDDGPLLAESSIELHRPLAEDADYRGPRRVRVGGAAPVPADRPLRPDHLPLRPVLRRYPGRHRDQRVRHPPRAKGPRCCLD